jgi:predicted RNA-binding protein associated with RNAse of E/G family
MDSEVIVIKQNHLGQEVWRYSGKVLEKGLNSILLEAFFNRQDLPFHGMLLATGDRFIELYFSDRWYNIYEIHDRQDNHLKGWYCNVTYPAVFEDGFVTYRDLALDLLVFPDGRQLVLDEDEFAALQLPDPDRLQARTAIGQLQAMFKPPIQLALEPKNP